MTEQQFQRIAKALSDPQRFAILERIAGGSDEVACKALVDEFAVSAPTISHHIRELQSAGLVEARKQGQCMYLRPCPRTIDGYTSRLRKRLVRSQ